jgi:hypothetical protein
VATPQDHDVGVPQVPFEDRATLLHGALIVIFVWQQRWHVLIVTFSGR